MGIIVLFLGALLGLGIWEHKRHQQRIDSIPLRININGIRGKSTVTRLTTGIMIEAGYRTVGKTTGTAARMIYWDKQEEKPIKRRLEGPNIREQKVVVAEAAALGAECLVSECMAVNPDYQIVFQEKMLQANIGVIVNVLEDHMDVMGPTLNEVAEAFTATIPYNGHLIVSDGPYVPYFIRAAKKRNTTVLVADDRRISERYLRRFDYMIFPQNASLALAVAEAVGIDEETALRGMLNAPPDPGAMRILPLDKTEQPAYFVNGFAANDASSTLNIWERVTTLGYPTNDPIVIMNCRADRVDRSIQFADDVLPHMQIDILISIGESTEPIVEAYRSGSIKCNHFFNLEECSTQEIWQVIKEHLPNRMVYGIGNIHGAAEPVCHIFEKMNEEIKEKRNQPVNRVREPILRRSRSRVVNS
ncbi:poly-gamma-glutamate synthase PgsB [Hazenella sp. IB182357]|uniref:Poly-gamma-glutamate synthase PgsB n=1 Tax=Polycladospora coralii TaxID=2771432 RepID=A0A926RWQ6_9BACL|nr:poly-gamma-glutamate synthase PgsB [Polycladospora coralii]MBD1371761.1 poly-gamma-glutamate synthase PgsB [Polycladospora coralii]